MKDGKPIIIEGVHLDPSIYLMDEENQETSGSNVSTSNSSLENTSLIMTQKQRKKILRKMPQLGKFLML